MERVLLIRAGEIVTCENGHEICEVACDIHRDDELKAEQFRNFRQIEQPKDGDPMLPCKICGGAYHAKGLGYFGVRIKGRGWVPDLPVVAMEKL